MNCALLLSLVLLIVEGCGPAAGASPPEGVVQAQVGARAARGASFSQDFVDRTCAEALAALDHGVGIRLLRPVPAVLLTAEQALARRKVFAASLPEGAGVTRGMDLLADFVFSTTMLGRYLPDEKVLYVLDDVLRRYASDERHARELLFAVVAHELVHAHDDQVYAVFPDLNALMADLAGGDTSELPSLQVLMSLLEGHATWASELACAEARVKPLRAMTMDDVRDMDAFDGGGNPLLEGLAVAGNAVARLKAVQYVQGREFCRRAMTFGGEPFMREVFTHLPLTADELGDFELFKVRWAQQKEAELEAKEAEAPATGG
jgi:hypothetical protein